MEATRQVPPAWYVTGNRLLWPTIARARAAIDERKSGDLALDMMPAYAVIHLIHCLSTSIEANEKGRHAVAISLVRQCVEALTLCELGLQRPSYRDPLLRDWRDEKKSQGKLREVLERDIWPAYGKGLWTETWAQFAGEFARAVQPYAHYTRLLQGWQLAVASGDELRQSQDGHYRFIAHFGVNTYDSVKATRITLLHCLLGWTVARILVSNAVSDVNAAEVARLGDELSKSELLGSGQLTWHQTFWPLMFQNPKKKDG